MRVPVIATLLFLVSACHASRQELKGVVDAPFGLQRASQEWKDAVMRGDWRAIMALAEEPSTRQALRESLPDPSDPIANYFFGSKRSVRDFFNRNENLTRRIIRIKGTGTYYVCYYDPDRFKGEWSPESLRGYSLDLESIVCESFYEREGNWYLDFDMPIFDGD
ncbi:hypothetical protein [Thermomonas haemolytica]|uniref:hypothetical protein n=1 Tax=Thermomonas haemolytica TaxID=141949 RepID=UPI001044EFBE|nr:hypothetical protein [Thermomonas haemolytica]